MLEEYNRYNSGLLLRNRYLKVADISEGSYGLVTVAKDTKSNDALVAIKCIYPLDYKKNKRNNDDSRPSSSPAKLRLSNDEELKKKDSGWKSLFEEASKEINIHKVLGLHSHITELYDSFDTCLVLEYCSRGDLYEAIQQGSGPTLSQDIKDVFSQILGALDYCHGLGVYHRDLKPENILISEDWSIKICDWGLATTNRYISNKSEFDIGSERYMAPELFDKNLESYDAAKIDLWSAGIILLTLVFRKNPFRVANYSDKCFVQFAHNRDALFDIFSTMTGDMFSVTRYCLNIDPANRDLKSLMKELDLVKYFTYDEEFWASDYEDEYENEDDFSNEEFVGDNEFFENEEEPKNADPKDTQIEKLSTKSSSDEREDIREGIVLPASENNYAHNHRADALKEALLDTDMPHNHRADALLTEGVRPIPIDENKNYRFIRNTRKPFHVASFNHSSSKMHGISFSHNEQKFNREDYFTPKSVFKHYMDKYGDRKSDNPVRNGHFNGFRNSADHGNGNSGWKKRKGRKRRQWKKGRQGNNKTGRRAGRSQYLGLDLNNQNHPSRKKSSLFSLARSQNKMDLFEGPVPNSFSHFGLLNPEVSNSIHGSSKKKSHDRAKNMHYLKSPDIEPLAEELSSMAVQDDDFDEVFQLDSDFDVANNQSLYSNKNNVPTNVNETSDKKQTFKFPTYSIPIPGDSVKSFDSSVKTHLHGPVPNPLGKRDSSDRRFSSTQSGTTFSLTELSPSHAMYMSNGKYVPPFRRASHSHFQNGHVSSQDANRPSAIAVDKKGMQFYSTKAGPIDEGKCAASHASSLPSTGSSWSHFKKHWNAYDDYEENRNLR